IAPLFSMVAEINRVVALEQAGGGADQLRRAGYDVALLLPNSFNVARIAWRAGIRERWGYRSDFRTLLLTKSVPTPSRVHQTEGYRHLVRALGVGGGATIEPRIELTVSHREGGRALLRGPGR